MPADVRPKLVRFLDGREHDVPTCQKLLAALSPLGPTFSTLVIDSLYQELDRDQFESFLDLSDDERREFVTSLTEFSAEDRTRIFGACRECPLDMRDLLVRLLEYESGIETDRSSCQICDWKREARKKRVRDANATGQMAKERAEEWKRCSELPKEFDVFSFSDVEGMPSVSFSEAASRFICAGKRDTIHLQRVCASCMPEIRSFVADPSAGNDIDPPRDDDSEGGGGTSEEQRAARRCRRARDVAQKKAEWWESELRRSELDEAKRLIVAARANVESRRRRRELEEASRAKREEEARSERMAQAERAALVEDAMDRDAKWIDFNARTLSKRLGMMQLFSRLQSETLEEGTSTGDDDDGWREGQLRRMGEAKANGLDVERCAKVPLTKEEASRVFGAPAPDCPEDDSDLVAWTRHFNDRAEEHKLELAASEAERDIMERFRWERDMSEWLEKVRRLLGDIEAKDRLERERIEALQEARERRKELNRERRRAMEAEARRRRAEQALREEELRRKRERERLLEIAESERMGRAEAEQSRIDRFWGLPTLAACRREAELLERRRRDLQTRERSAMMAAVGEVLLERKEGLDLPDVLGVNEHTLKEKMEALSRL